MFKHLNHFILKVYEATKIICHANVNGTTPEQVIKCLQGKLEGKRVK